MTDINDANCSVCKNQKMVFVGSRDNRNVTIKIRSEYWGYFPSPDEYIIEGYCPGCGIKFVKL